MSRRYAQGRFCTSQFQKQINRTMICTQVKHPSPGGWWVEGGDRLGGSDKHKGCVTMTLQETDQLTAPKALIHYHVKHVLKLSRLCFSDLTTSASIQCFHFKQKTKEKKHLASLNTVKNHQFYINLLQCNQILQSYLTKHGTLWGMTI